MKRLAVCLLLLFLTGCSENPELQEGIELRSRLLQASQCSFSVSIQADYGDELSEFAMDCTADEKGSIGFTVTAPESISGISGTLSASGGELTFDGTAVDFGYLADGELSPVSGPWIFLNTLRSGNITSACEEEGKIRLSVDDSYQEDALRLDIWLDESGLPVHADVLSQGRRILALGVKDFRIL